MDIINQFIIRDNRVLLAQNKYIPPETHRRRVGNYHSIRHYLASGLSFFRIIEKLCSPRGPHQRFLDVGCGCGQVARYFIDYLARDGHYDGFDIDKDMIAWCQMNITSPHSNFHFSHIDVFNSAYAEAGGKLDAAQFRFPFEEHLFDIVFAKSVFTHLLPKEAENYLAQISRVLKKGGRAIVTFFLLNKKSSEAIRSRKSTLRFKHTFGPSLSISKKNPERALCYQEKFIFNLFRKYRLRLKRPYSRGTWPHLTTPQANYQDILIAVKF